MEAEAARVREAYGDFWQHIKFRKGWAKPPFPQERADPFLREAAGLVVCIRSLLDRRSAAGDVKVRTHVGVRTLRCEPLSPRTPFRRCGSSRARLQSICGV